MVPTLQCCVAQKKSLFRIVPCNITFSEKASYMYCFYSGKIQHFVGCQIEHTRIWFVYEGQTPAMLVVALNCT